MARGVDDQVAPVLFILPTPDELWIEVRIARILHLTRTLLFLLNHGLNSAVGIFFRFASSCVSVSTVFFWFSPDRFLDIRLKCEE